MNGTKQGQTGPNGVKRGEMGPNGAKQGKTGPKGAKRGQMTCLLRLSHLDLLKVKATKQNVETILLLLAVI